MIIAFRRQPPPGDRAPIQSGRIEVDEDANAEEMAQALRLLMISMGYHPDNVRDALGPG